MDMEEIATTTTPATGSHPQPYAKEEKINPTRVGPFKIDFVPYNTPWREHLQALAVALHIAMMLFGWTVGPFLFAYTFLYTRFWFIVPMYMAWMFYDRETAFRGGRKWPWLRRNVIFQYYRDYFPSKLIKTHHLPADKNYLFVVYPHGILSCSTLSCFGCEVNHLESQVFPGLDFRVVTLDLLYYGLITREYLLLLGGIGARYSSIKYVLNSKPSKAVVLIAGGAAEAQFAFPSNTYRIVISGRKGFVRMALQTGTSLVPVFSFGENHVCSQYQSKWLTKGQLFFKKITGIYPVIPKGRGIWQRTFGMLPNIHPINTVVGKPIAIPKIEDPTDKDIDYYHTVFVQELSKLFETHKLKYDAAGADAKLIML